MPKTTYGVLADLERRATEVMDYLAWQRATGSRKYCFRPSPQGKRKLIGLRDAIHEARSHLRGAGVVVPR